MFPASICICIICTQKIQMYMCIYNILLSKGLNDLTIGLFSESLALYGLLLVSESVIIVTNIKQYTSAYMYNRVTLELLNSCIDTYNIVD